MVDAASCRNKALEQCSVSGFRKPRFVFRGASWPPLPPARFSQGEGEADELMPDGTMDSICRGGGWSWSKEGSWEASSYG